MENLGFQGTLDKVIAIWKRNSMNWQHRSLPWRPSREDIDLYKTLADEKLLGRTLILGATPELRDLVASTGNQVTLIDICPEMVEATSKLLTISHPEKETQIIDDWQTMPFPDSHFDIVLGDFFWWLFSVSSQKVLGKELSRILKPDGVLVTRVHFCNTDIIGISQENIIKKHLLLLDKSNADRNGIKEILISRLLDATTDISLQRLDTARAATTVEKMLAYSITSHRSFLEECAAALRGRINWTSQSRKQILKSLNENFFLEQEVSAQDYEDSHFFPVLKLKKRPTR